MVTDDPERQEAKRALEGALRFLAALLERGSLNNP